MKEPGRPLRRAQTSGPARVHIAIVGCGFAGLGAAIRLKQRGERDFVVLERGSEVGGVWRDNTYPGCACDVQSHLYSYSFAPNPSWSRSYSPQGEIWQYLLACADRFGVLPHVRFGHDVLAACWDGGAWRISTSRGAFTADIVIAAGGALSEPALPRIAGIERFQGPAFHSARWRHDVGLENRRVAVVGTGASAAQFVPAIQPKVAQLHVFQRTPPWVLPRKDKPIPPWATSMFRALPITQGVVRAALYATREVFLLGFRAGRVNDLVEDLARRHLERSVRDPALRAKLTPSYRIGCKRIIVSDDYWASLAAENVEVVTTEIREVRGRGVITADGRERECDVLIFGTGFHVTDPPFAARVRGRDGRTLHETWEGSPQAHLGTTVAGFPNFFLLSGPNTGLGHTSVILMIEAQIEHVLKALAFLERRPGTAIEPTREAQADFARRVDQRMRGSVWTAGGCASWYLDGTGRNSTLWPDQTFSFTRLAGRFDPKKYVLLPEWCGAQLAQPLSRARG